MKTIKCPNKSIEKLLRQISESDAIELFKVKNGEWKKQHWHQGITFTDLRVWIRKNFD